MLNSIILLGGLVSAFGLGAISPSQDKQDNVQFRLENHKAVSFNDDDHQITLDVNEANNYVWNNASSLIIERAITAIGYNGDGASYTNFSGASVNYVGGSFTIGFAVVEGAEYSFDVVENQFFLYNSSYTQLDFEYSIILHVNTSKYNDLKSAIELDIQANQPSNDYSPILGDIVSLLVSGITSFAGGLGAGVSALVGDIFISNGSLSVFAYMVVIFAGISLAIGLSRWVMNFLTSLGRKK